MPMIGKLNISSLKNTELNHYKKRRQIVLPALFFAYNKIRLIPLFFLKISYFDAFYRTIVDKSAFWR